ncbi:calcium-binding protein [Streptomyces sp. NPDC127068]|uniref:calcium-binding protein n=1 Tax=Streptomyces sp. NPDC127068 TaxID=3347127 RepID=UPI00364B0CB9
MRMRAPIAVVSGALALSALTVPSARSDGGGPRPPGAPSAFAGDSTTGRLTGITVNGGEDVVVGTSVKKFSVEVGAFDEGGVERTAAALYQGLYLTSKTLITSYEAYPAPCERTATSATCRFVFEAHPKSHAGSTYLDLKNKHAGVWKVAGGGFRGLDGPGRTVAVAEDIHYDDVSVKRAAKVTADASPESVRRGADVTVKGTLTRANWDTHRYDGFSGGAVKVKLQFKKAGGSWGTVKTVSADGRGKVKATVKASVDGSYRFTYGGSTTTGRATSPADTIDVR